MPDKTNSGEYDERRIHPISIFLLLMLLMVPATSSANSPPPAPQPAFTLRIENPPDEPYGVAILIREPTSDSVADNNLKIKPNQQEMIRAMHSLEDTGWYPIVDLPSGGLVRVAGDQVIIWKHLEQKPTNYRILYVTQSGIVQVTEPIIRRAYANSAAYDTKTNQLKQDLEIAPYLKSFIIAAVMTLIIELPLLPVFGFSIKKNWRIIIVTNLITQIIFNVILFLTEYYEAGPGSTSLVLWMELAILIVEATVYGFKLRERCVALRILYASLANISSLITGLIIYWIVMWF